MTVGFAYQQAPPGVTPNGTALPAASSTTPTAVFRFRTASAGAIELQAFYDAGQPPERLRLRLIRVKDSVALWTSAGPLVDDRWCSYIELKIVLHATAGSVELKVNEVTQVALTNIDTRSSAASDTTVNAIEFLGGAGNNWNVDDIYLNNGSGSLNTGFKGDTQVFVLRPNAAGDSTQFTPTGVPDNWDNINEPNVTYNANNNNNTEISGNTDLYNVDNLPTEMAGQAVFGTQVYGMLQCFVSGGASTATLLIKSGGSESASASLALTAAGVGFASVFETKPGGGAWTTTDIDAAQIGLRSTSNVNVRMYRNWIEVAVKKAVTGCPPVKRILPGVRVFQRDDAAPRVHGLKNSTTAVDSSVRVLGHNTYQGRKVR